MHINMLLGIAFDKQERVAGDAQATHQHGRNGNQRAQKSAHGDGYADQIVQKSKKERLHRTFLTLLEISTMDWSNPHFLEREKIWVGNHVIIISVYVHYFK